MASAAPWEAGFLIASKIKALNLSIRGPYFCPYRAQSLCRKDDMVRGHQHPRPGHAVSSSFL